MKFLFKGERIDYEYLSGHNKTIIFLHGWGGNKNSFINTINLLKNKFNILTITMPSIKNTCVVWNMCDYVDLVNTVLKLHNINSVTVICHSFGFRVASLIDKNKIEKLIVTGGAGPKKISVFKKITIQNNRILLKQNKFKFLFSKVASKDYQSLSKINQQTFKNIVNLNTKNFTKFNCPVLIFWGKNDKDTKLWIAKKLKKENKSKVILTNSDHFAYLKMNALFNHSVLEFLK